MTTGDVLLIIPAVPGLILLVTCWLPWEHWIPWAKISRLVLGPYVLYLGFIAWHFGAGRGIVGWVSAVGLVLVLIGAMERHWLPWGALGPSVFLLGVGMGFTEVPWIAVVLLPVGAVATVVSLILRYTPGNQTGSGR